MRTGLILIIFATSVCFNLAQAREIEGIHVSEKVSLSGTKTRLVLNGAGVRTKFLSRIYVGALYLPQFASSAEAILQQTGPRRVSMYILYDALSKEQLAEAWTDGFRDNHNEQEFSAFKQRLQQFNSLFTPVKKGDVILLDYLPETGTSVRINGQLKGTITGADFYQALLKVWLGEKPVDDDLKQAMLGAG